MLKEHNEYFSKKEKKLILLRHHKFPFLCHRNYNESSIPAAVSHIANKHKSTSSTIIFFMTQFPFGPVGIYLFKVNNRNTRTRCQICSKLTIKTPEQRLASLTYFAKQFVLVASMEDQT